MLTKSLYLEIDKPNYVPIYTVQYDYNSRFYEITILNNSQPLDLTGIRVIVAGKKPDGKEVFNSCKVLDAKKGLIQLELTEQMNAVNGASEYALELFSADGMLSSQPFKLIVTRSTISKSVESSKELGALKDALNEVQDIDNRFAQTNAQLSDNVNKLNIEKADKITTINLQGQIDNLVIQGTGDSNPEVIQARGNFNLLNTRLNYFDDKISGDYYTTEHSDTVVKLTPIFNDGGYWGKNGFEQHGSYVTSNSIFLNKYEFITFYANGENANVFVLAEVDVDKNFIKSLIPASDFTGSKMYKFVADKDMYISIASKKGFNNTYSKGFSDLKKLSDDVSVAKGFFNPNEVRTSNHYIGLNGKAEPHGAYSYITFNANYGDVINYKCQSQDSNVVSAISLYDKDDNFIKSIYTLTAGSFGLNTYQYVCEINDAIIKCSFRSNVTVLYELVTKHGGEESLKRIGEDIKDLRDSIPSIPDFKIDLTYYSAMFKEVVCIGDSLTKGVYGSEYVDEKFNYPNFIQSMSDGWVVANYGAGGHTPVTYWNSVINTINFTNKDLFIICLGTNGTLTDTIEDDTDSGDYNTYSDTNTGRYCSIIEKIKDERPNSSIFIITTFAGNYSVNNPIIKKIAQKYDIDVVDIEEIKTWTDSSYHPFDSVHLGKKGYFLMAKMILDGICNIVSNNINKFNIWG